VPKSWTLSLCLCTAPWKPIQEWRTEFHALDLLFWSVIGFVRFISGERTLAVASFLRCSVLDSDVTDGDVGMQLLCLGPTPWRHGVGSSASRVLNFGIRLTGVVSFTLRPFYSRGRNLRYLLCWMLGGSQNRYGHCNPEKHACPCWNSDPGFFIYLWLYCPLLDLGRYFNFLILYTVGRTPWMGC
jgi:hypothetical protein